MRVLARRQWPPKPPLGTLAGDARVQTILRLGPAGEGADCSTEQQRSSVASRDRAEQGRRLLRKRDVMRHAVFGPAGRHRPDCLVEVELTPGHAGDLATALARQQQQLQDARMTVLA